MAVQNEKVKALADNLVRYFVEEKNFFLYRGLFHQVPTRSELIALWELHQRDLADKWTLGSCIVKKYVQPNWGIFKTDRFDPEPTHSIAISLKAPDGGPDLYFACAPANGEYKICHYVSRTPNVVNEEPPPPETIDLAGLYDEVSGIISSAVASFKKELRGAPIGYVRMDYSFHMGNPPTYPVDIYTCLDPFDASAWGQMPLTGRCYSASEQLCRAHCAVKDGTCRIISVEGKAVDMAQDKFDQQFPAWIGMARFKKAVRTCMIQALADALGNSKREKVLSWKGPKTALVASYEELDDKTLPLKQTNVVNGVTFFGIQQRPAKPPKRPPGYVLRTVFSHEREAEIAARNKEEKRRGSTAEGADGIPTKGISEKKAIAAFARLMNPLIKAPPKNPKMIVDAFVTFCRDVRIRGAYDQVMLEWGANKPLVLKKFSDLREAGRAEYDSDEYQWLGLTRQIVAGRDDDDTALCVHIYFDNATGDEVSSNIEFDDLEEMDWQLGRLYKNAHVAKMLKKKPSRVVAFANVIG